jgi:hypothetical protein
MRCYVTLILVLAAVACGLVPVQPPVARTDAERDCVRICQDMHARCRSREATTTAWPEAVIALAVNAVEEECPRRLDACYRGCVPAVGAPLNGVEGTVLPHAAASTRPLDIAPALR